MGRLTKVAVTVLAAAVALAVASGARTAGGLCVGGPHCYATIQAALAAANAGETIRISPGTYAGGLEILKSVDLVGAGAQTTRISGGGPVLTIGSKTSAPTVSLTGLTVTGGLATSDPQAPNCGPDVPTCGPGYTTATALGGGIEAFPGTTVTIRSSVVTGNRAEPSTAVTSVKAVCPGPVACPASFGDAAGIDNWGAMTLTSSTVSDNHAAAVQSNGGGIVDEAGATLSIVDSRVTGNSASAAPPFGRFVSGGGIFVAGGATLTVENSSIDGNVASLANSIPHPYPLQGGGADQASAFGGGVYVSDGATASITNVALEGNAVNVDAPAGEPVGADAALCACGDVSLTLENSSVTGNAVDVDILSSADAGPMGGIVEGDGNTTIRGTRVTDNTVSVRASAGDAGALGTLVFFPAPGEGTTIDDGAISQNAVAAISPAGAATLQGAGITNNGPLLLRHVQVDDNAGTAKGLTGFAEGGGIWNGVLFGGPQSPLTLENTHVDRNSLVVGSGLTAQGGGIFTDGFPLTLDHGVVQHNSPDDCVGC